MNEEQVRKMVEEMLTSVVAKTAASVSVGKFKVAVTWNVTSEEDKYTGEVDASISWDAESK